MSPSGATTLLETPPETPLVEFTAYVDGAVNPNPGRGGWGVFLSSGKREKRLSGTVPEERTTNQRAEIHAAIRALTALKVPCRVRVLSDSQ